MNPIFAFFQSLSTNFTKENIFLFALGFIIYFIYAFKTWKKEPQKFSWKVWFKDNWYNIPLCLLCGIAWFTLTENVSPEEAFGVGLSPNILIDFVSKMIENNKKKSE